MKKLFKHPLFWLAVAVIAFTLIAKARSKPVKRELTKDEKDAVKKIEQTGF